MNHPDDNIINELFDGFDPELASDREFENRFVRNLELIDMTRSTSMANKRQNRHAVVIAVITGFVCGVLSMLFFPTLSQLAARVINTFYDAGVADNVYTSVAWCSVTLAVLAITCLAYDIGLGLTGRRGTDRVNVRRP